MRKPILIVCSLAVIGFLTLNHYNFSPLIYWTAKNEIRHMLENEHVTGDEFKFLFCGTGSPNRTPNRGQPCLALLVAGKLFLFDAGEGAIAKLREYGAPLSKLDKIFLTHLHSDHMSGVAEVLHNTWLYGRRNEVELVGPPDTEAMLANINRVYHEDLVERQRVLGVENISTELAFGSARDVVVNKGSMDVVYENNGLLIKAFHVDHKDWSHAYGYRIEYKGKSIVISGDTAPSDGIRTYAKDADILIHEALNEPLMTLIGEQFDELNGPIPGSRMKKISSVHTTTLELAEIAQHAKVKKLVLTHLIPALPSIWIAERFFVAGMDDIYGGDITVAEDGQWMDVSKL